MLNTSLINGTNQDADGNGNYSQVTMESGKKYRLRLINMSVDNCTLRSSSPFYTQALTLQIQTFRCLWTAIHSKSSLQTSSPSNLSPPNGWSWVLDRFVRPTFDSSLTNVPRQRYDVIITANQSAGNYWFRSNVSTACQSGNNFYGRAIWSYTSEPAATPYSTE